MIGEKVKELLIEAIQIEFGSGVGKLSAIFGLFSVSVIGITGFVLEGSISSGIRIGNQLKTIDLFLLLSFFLIDVHIAKPYFGE